MRVAARGGRWLRERTRTHKCFFLKIKLVDCGPVVRTPFANITTKVWNLYLMSRRPSLKISAKTGKILPKREEAEKSLYNAEYLFHSRRCQDVHMSRYSSSWLVLSVDCSPNHLKESMAKAEYVGISHSLINTLSIV